MNLVWFVLIAFGLTQSLVYGSIFNNIRPSRGKLGELFHCSMCMGFWVGMLLWLINDYTELISFDYSLVTGLFCGFVSSGTSYVLNMVFGDEGIKVEHKGISRKSNINYRRWK
jgi:hypothetical protein